MSESIVSSIFCKFCFIVLFSLVYSLSGLNRKRLLMILFVISNIIINVVFIVVNACCSSVTSVTIKRQEFQDKSLYALELFSGKYT